MRPEELSAGLAAVPSRYHRTMAAYSRWANCTTPLEQFASFLKPFWSDNEDEPLFAYTHPFKCLYVYESLGVCWPTRDPDGDLLLLWRGKNVRDWWARELREWNRLGGGVPIFNLEEFRDNFPVRSCFIEAATWQAKSMTRKNG